MMTSPDASYRVTARRSTMDELRGRGESWGTGMAEVQWPADTFVARRIGPPDARVCFAQPGNGM